MTRNSGTLGCALMERPKQSRSIRVFAAHEAQIQQGTVVAQSRGEPTSRFARRCSVPVASDKANQPFAHFPDERDCMNAINQIVAKCLWSASLAMASVSCGAAPDATQEDTAKVSSAYAAVQSWHDSNNTLTVTLYTCDNTDIAQHPSATCSVPDTDALVGGGATTDANGADPGALLVSSYPLDKLTWYAASKDHLFYHPHRLQVSALGLRLSGVSGQQLRDMLRIDSTCADSVQPSPHTGLGFVGLGPTSDRVTVGGGSQSLYTGAGRLLRRSAPWVNGSGEVIGWLSESIDLGTPDSGWLCNYVISLPRSSPDLPGGTISAKVGSASSFLVMTGYSTKTLTVSPTSFDGVVTSVGCSSSTSDGSLNRPLTRCQLAGSTFPVAVASSKDHGVPAGGYLAVDALQISASFVR